jgi:hypothetical protein
MRDGAGPRGMVFRDAATSSTLGELAQRARAAVKERLGEESVGPVDAFEALLAVCDYEGALADAGDAVHQLRVAARVADHLGEVVARGAWRPEDRACFAREVARLVSGASDRRPCVRKRAEGFAYYSLRPADVIRGLPSCDGDRAITVVGIRTIGTPLAALAAAGLALRYPDRDVARFTVRPEGDPYDRRVLPRSVVDHMVAAAIAVRLGERGPVIVIDEGPGLSGSSFLAVAEWLETAGAEVGQIILYGSRRPDPSGLCAPDAARRWGRYRSEAFAGPPLPEGVDLGGGRWRAALGLLPAAWPDALPLTDREKRLRFDLEANGRASIEKFEGLGEYGRACRERLDRLAEAGLGPPVVAVDPDRGTVTTSLIAGARPQRRAFRRWAPRLVEYCAWRARDAAFVCRWDEADPDLLIEATLHNAEQELGAAPDARALRVIRPLIVDGRLQPWEWIVTSTGALLKTDASSHGDDHFLPGPTDIAWDLAGVIVEWDLDETDRGAFLEAYGSVSGDRDLTRIGAFEVAYAAFRAAAYGMVRPTEDEDENARRRDERARLRERGRRALARPS